MKEYEKYFALDEPVPFIGKSVHKQAEQIERDLAIGGLSAEEAEKLENEHKSMILYIYPVTVDNYMDFQLAINILLIEKNKIPDPEIIKMSYLDFIFYYMEKDENGASYAYMLVELLKMCLHLDRKDIRYVKEDGKIKLIIKEVKYDKKDFDIIKAIICHQNIIDYDDTYIDPKVDAALREAEDFKNRRGKKTCSFEEQIVCVMIALNTADVMDVRNLSVRKFSLILRRYDYKMHYEIFKSAEMGGFVSFKQSIDHWMSDLSKERYSDVVMEFDALKDKMKGAV